MSNYIKLTYLFRKKKHLNKAYFKKKSLGILVFQSQYNTDNINYTLIIANNGLYTNYMQ